MRYPIEITTPIAKDLTDFGFEGLTTSDQVDSVLGSKDGTVLMVVNSICGCAAGNARPAAKFALYHASKPTKAVTVFAGVDTEAVEKAREYMLPYPPSSPAIALFKEGSLVHMIERHQIEGRSAQMIADELVQAMNSHCVPA